MTLSQVPHGTGEPGRSGGTGTHPWPTRPTHPLPHGGDVSGGYRREAQQWLGSPSPWGPGVVGEERGASCVLGAVTHPFPIWCLLRAYSVQSGLSEGCSGFPAWG